MAWRKKQIGFFSLKKCTYPLVAKELTIIDFSATWVVWKFCNFIDKWHVGLNFDFTRKREIYYRKS